MIREWERHYDTYADAELLVIHARIAGGDLNWLGRIERYLHEEKVGCIPWPPQVKEMPEIKSRGVDADHVSRF